MRTRLAGLGLLAAFALVVSACGGGSTPAPSGGGASSALKIGLVTDVGKLNDQNFNQYSWEGAQAGAKLIGAPEPKAAQSQASADIKNNIQSFVDQKFDIIVTVGFAAGADTTAAAKANPNIKFIGVDQGICIDETGANDTTFACKGDPATLLPNYQGLTFKEGQVGYLAGVVAAGISKSGHIASIGGTASVPAVPNYMIGYYNGAKASNPNVKVELQYISPAPDAKAFADPSGGKAFAQQLLSSYPDVDVLFQVAGSTGNGILQAACDAKIWGIGVDVDQYVSTPATKACTFVSAEKKLTKAVSDAIVRVSDGTAKGGTISLDITTDSVGLSSFHEFESQVTPELQKAIDAAVAGLKDGSIEACKLNAQGGCENVNGMPPTP
jgi:basic membrane protein A and related proteins